MPEISPTEIKLAQNLGEITMDLLEANDKLWETQQATEIDPLTKLPNRQGLERRMHQAIEHSRRANEPLSVAFVDTDELKEFNDNYGHDTGDALLRNVAQNLHLRDTDVVCRYGGDEFVIILVNANTTATDDNNISLGSRLAERLRQQSASQPFTYLDKKRQPQQTVVQFSIGFASLEPGDTLESLVARANAAMFADKNLRRQDPNLHMRR